MNNFAIPVQYLTALFAQAHVRPYENKFPLQNDITGSLSYQPLPENNHFRVELSLTATAVNSEGVKCFEVGASIEAILVVADAPSEEVIRQTIVEGAGPRLVGHLRAAIQNASLQSGYGPIVLPPLPVERLYNLLHQE